MIRFASANEAIEWINGARWKGEKNGLENTRALLNALGNPEKSMGRIVHVAGTNGKGSTCAMIERALRACGYTTGLFTSPYLCAFNERIRLNGKPIQDTELIEIASRVRDAATEISEKGVFTTTFEILTAMACLYYSEKKVDFSVMEVGMGGRLDSTNVLSPDVCAIAAIGLDHMSRLGNTLGEIAGEKAGILKKGVPAAVLSQTDEVMEVFRKKAAEADAPLYETSEVRLLHREKNAFEIELTLPGYGLTRQLVPLAGAHQAGNAALALTALSLLNIDMEKAQAGVSKTLWPGRLEWIGNVLIDGAHNPQGANALKEYLASAVTEKPVVLLTGMMADKQVEACSAIFRSFADRVVTTAVDWPRAISPKELTGFYENAEAVSGVENALSRAKALAGENGVVIAAGSIYLAGDVRNLLLPEDGGCL